MVHKLITKLSNWVMEHYDYWVLSTLAIPTKFFMVASFNLHDTWCTGYLSCKYLSNVFYCSSLYFAFKVWWERNGHRRNCARPNSFFLNTLWLAPLQTWKTAREPSSSARNMVGSCTIGRQQLSKVKYGIWLRRERIWTKFFMVASFNLHDALDINHVSI